MLSKPAPVKKSRRTIPQRFDDPAAADERSRRQARRSLRALFRRCRTARCPHADGISPNRQAKATRLFARAPPTTQNPRTVTCLLILVSLTADATHDSD